MAKYEAGKSGKKGKNVGNVWEKANFRGFEGMGNQSRSNDGIFWGF